MRRARYLRAMWQGLLLASVPAVGAHAPDAGADDSIQPRRAASTITSAPVVTTTGDAVTSTSFVTSSSMQRYENEMIVGVFPARPIASLTVRVVANTDYGPATDAFCSAFPGDEPAKPMKGTTTLDFLTTLGHPLDRSQQLLLCGYSTHEPHGPLDASSFGFWNVEAADADGQPVVVEFCILDFEEKGLPVPAPGECRHACGDAVCDGGELNTTDALGALRASVGLRNCPKTLCDTDADDAVDSTDALRVLRRAVGHDVPLLCLATACW